MCGKLGQHRGFEAGQWSEIWVSGLRAAEFLNHVLTNDIAQLEPGGAQYSLLCNDGGGVSAAELRGVAGGLERELGRGPR